MNYWLLTIPLVSALIGHFAGMISGRILENFISGRGRARLAENVGDLASTLFKLEQLESLIMNKANIQKAMPVVEAHIDDFLRHKLKAKMPMIGMLIGEKTIQSLKEVFMNEIEEMIPRVLQQFTGSLKNEVDVKSLVASNLRGMPGERIRSVLRPMTRYNTLTATMTGFVVGLVNLAIIFLFPA